MKKHLKKCTPHLFQADTTFGTQTEGYKLYCLVYHSQFTGMWEVASLILLATETKKNVQAGLEFFKASLPYNLLVNQCWIFFTDKDFDYIDVIFHHPFVIYFFFICTLLNQVLEEVFPGCIVLLCNVHTSRYFHDRIFTSNVIPTTSSKLYLQSMWQSLCF